MCKLCNRTMSQLLSVSKVSCFFLCIWMDTSLQNTNMQVPDVVSSFWNSFGLQVQLFPSDLAHLLIPKWSSWEIGLTDQGNMWACSLIHFEILVIRILWAGWLDLFCAWRSVFLLFVYVCHLTIGSLLSVSADDPLNLIERVLSNILKSFLGDQNEDSIEFFFFLRLLCFLCKTVTKSLASFTTSDFLAKIIFSLCVLLGLNYLVQKSA